MDQLVLGEAKESVDFVLIPEDRMVEAKVLEAKIYTSKMTDDDGEPVKRVRFKFGCVQEVITDDEGAEIDISKRKVYGETSVSFVPHENCKLYAWTLAILGINELPKGFAMPIDDNGNLTGLVDGRCRIITEINTWDDKKNPIPQDDGSVKYPKKSNNRVKGVAKSRTAAPATASAEEFDEEPFRVDAGEWWPEVGLGKYPTRLLP